MAFQKDHKDYLRYLKAKADVEERLKAWEEEQSTRVRKAMDFWLSLDGITFEEELTKLFMARGFDATQTKGSGDEGVDIILKKDGKVILVQCKAYGKPVGSGPIRDLYGTLLHQKTDEAWLISTRGFSDHARKFAEGKPISLLSIEQII